VSLKTQRFPLPDVGEGLTEAEIVEWQVAVGDTVEVNQTIVEIETAKSLVDLPSPWTGTVSALLVEAGTTVDVGTPIIEITVPDTGGSDGSAPAGSAAGSDGTPAAGAPRTRAPDRCSSATARWRRRPADVVAGTRRARPPRHRSRPRP